MMLATDVAERPCYRIQEFRICFQNALTHRRAAKAIGNDLKRGYQKSIKRTSETKCIYGSVSDASRGVPGERYALILPVSNRRD